MLKISDTYKELGVAFELPIKIKDENGNVTYFERSDGYWCRKEYDAKGNETYIEISDSYWCHREYDANGNVTYYESSSGYWYRNEYDSNGKNTHYENSKGYKEGIKRSASCAGKIIEVDGKKYKLTEV